jgi:hypothetical protein
MSDIELRVTDPNDPHLEYPYEREPTVEEAIQWLGNKDEVIVARLVGGLSGKPEGWLLTYYEDEVVSDE